MVEIKSLSIKGIEAKIKSIEKNIAKLKISRDPKVLDDMEFEIYYLRGEIADQYYTYALNCHAMEMEKWRQHLIERPKHNSDLTSSKAVNKILKDDIAKLNLQEAIIERLEKKENPILRIANHINSMRIWDLAIAKTQRF